MLGKTTRYCGKCKRTMTKTSMAEFEAHVARNCADPPVARPVVLARHIRQAKAPKAQKAPREPRARPVYVPPPPEVHPKLNEALEKFPVTKGSFCGLLMNFDHLKMEVLEAYENPDLIKDLDDVHAKELLEMQSKAVWDEDVLGRYFGWCDSRAFATGAAMVSPLTTVVEYAENDATASKDIKPKLRYVTKALRTLPDPRDVIIMMACHGGLCHVQKEIGVRCAYAALSGTLKSDMDTQNPKNAVLRLLIETREACIEDLYRAQYLNGAKSLNSHGLVGYRNEICDQIGLVKIPDLHASTYPVAHSYVNMYYQRFYTVETLVERVWRALNERKIHYASVVAFLQYNRPIKFVDDAEEFLFHCFNSAGLFTRQTAAYLLWKYDVFKPAEGVSGLKIEADLFPPIDEAELDEIRKSKDLIMSGARLDNTPLALSKGKGELSESAESVNLGELFGDEIRSSVDHRCEDHHFDHERQDPEFPDVAFED